MYAWTERAMHRLNPKTIALLAAIVATIGMLAGLTGH